MTQRHLIDVDITDRADGKIPVWNNAGNTHVYDDPTAGSGINPGQAVDYPSAFTGDTINGSSAAPFADVAAFDVKEVLNSRIVHLRTLGASKNQKVRVTLGTTKAGAFDVRVCCAFASGAWTSTNDSTYFEVRLATAADVQLFAARFIPSGFAPTDWPRSLYMPIKVGGGSMSADDANIDWPARSGEAVTLRFVRDGSDVITPTVGYGTAPMALVPWKVASNHVPFTATVAGTLERIEFNIVTPAGPGATVAFDAYIDYLASV